MSWLFTTYLYLFTLGWGVFFARALLNLRVVPIFDEIEFTPTNNMPKVSIIIAACNEATTLAETITNLLQQVYRNFELIIVNDRSTDQTGAIAEHFAQQDARIKSITLSTLPAGWLGKVHALYQGVKEASGEWLLFTDADVQFAPDTLTRALGIATARQLDHLALFPQVLSTSSMFDSCVQCFRVLFFESVNPRKVKDPENNAAVGVGAFNLVKRATLEKTPGLRWLKLEVGDDVGLAYLLKIHRARTDFMFARKHLSLRWYPTLADMIHGMEKNLFAVGMRYSVSRTVVSCLLLVSLSLAPWIVLFTSSFVWQALSIASLSVWVFFSLYSHRRIQTRILPALLMPLGFLLMAYMIARSAYLALRRGGIEWRGTFYVLEGLRKGRRYKR